MLIDAEWLNRHLTTEITILGGPLRQDMTHKKLAPRIACVDGYSVSVQASRTAYSTPRDNHGPWSEVECGFAMYPDGASPIQPDEDSARRLEAIKAREVAGVEDAFARFDAERAAHRHLYAFVEEWSEYADGGGKRGDNVYGYVPVEAVVSWVNAHGGVVDAAPAPTEQPTTGGRAKDGTVGGWSK